MTASIERRLQSLEAASELEPLLFIPWSDPDDPIDVEEEIAKFRSARNWPDDGAHPLNVIIVSWLGSADEDAAEL